MSKPRPTPARRKALNEARQSAKQTALMVHMKVLSEIAAGVAERARGRSDLFDGFFEELAEDARGLLEEGMAAIDDAHRLGFGHPPPAMKS